MAKGVTIAFLNQDLSEKISKLLRSESNDGLSILFFHHVEVLLVYLEENINDPDLLPQAIIVDDLDLNEGLLESINLIALKSEKDLKLYVTNSGLGYLARVVRFPFNVKSPLDILDLRSELLR